MADPREAGPKGPERMGRPTQRWGVETKRMVVLVVLAIAAFIIYQFRIVIPPLAVALILAFILEPIVTFLERRLRLPRTLATALVFLLLIVAMLGVVAAPVTAVPSVQRAIIRAQGDLMRIINAIGSFLNQPLVIGEYSLDLSPVLSELQSMLSRFVGRVAQGTLDIVFEVASGAVWLVFIIVAAFYMVNDARRLVRMVDSLAPPGYRRDFVRLREKITEVWNAFLRGKLVLGGIVAVMTFVVCLIIGMPYAVVLSLIAGVLEMVPSIGPTLAAIPAVIVALLQGSLHLGLSNVWFAVLAAGCYSMIQQIENNLLVPKILGRNLRLHPLVVTVAFVIGGNVAGILGMLLAAPVVATLFIIVRYVFDRLYDRDPFPDEDEEPAPQSRMSRWLRRTWSRVRDSSMGRRLERAWVQTWGWIVARWQKLWRLARERAQASVDAAAQVVRRRRGGAKKAAGAPAEQDGDPGDRPADASGTEEVLSADGTFGQEIEQEGAS